MAFITGSYTFPLQSLLNNCGALSGLDPKLPEFVLRQQRKRHNGLVAPTARPPRVPDDEGNDEWTPEKERSSRHASKSGSVGGGRRGGHKGKAEWSAPAWTGRRENYDDAPLSVDQVDIIPLWTPAKLVAGAKGAVKVCLLTLCLCVCVMHFSLLYPDSVSASVSVWT
ncbi:hypothetical protein C7M84_022174 [Penaeus vannamei]|uniref:Uncharacterized protein n=1 Tax=Penaeus vannamei TaxID=6689 RepID=A0A3R7QND9_PENVA|nr:hypothetical protein C7M84_022174 [Penaeus vannamei]